MNYLSGSQVGAENVEKLRSYLADLERSGEAVPLTKEGRPNLSAIALACGFDRQVLYKNPHCKDLISAKVRAIGGSTQTTTPTAKSDFDPKERRIRELERQIADLSERLAQAERDLKEAQQYQRLYEFAQENGRDLLP